MVSIIGVLHPATRFIGRTAELVEVRSLLEQNRLLTLTGPGGVGKTRLALQLAETMQPHYRHCVHFVPLSAIGDPRLVVPAIAAVLGIQSSDVDGPAAATIAWLRDKQSLLVLDNFEQVVDAAPSVGEILAHRASLSMLVTSRVRLHLAVEQEYPVQPLGLPAARSRPSLETAGQSDAVALFVRRAQQGKPDFALAAENAALIVDICRGLDGLPLAIELAAARIKLLSPHEMQARLDQRLRLLTGGPRDAPVRQQTMRDTIAWSVGLLSAADQRLFRQLAVFTGGWTLDAAEAVCDPDLDWFTGLETLVDHNLVRRIEQEQQPARFAMLKTIREYALEQLAEAGESVEMRRRHAGFYQALALSSEPPRYWGKRSDAWLRWIAAEHDNVRAAGDWALEDEPPAALRLGSSLYWFWLLRSHLQEGRHWLEQALDLASGAPPGNLAKGYATLGDILCWQGRFADADGRYRAGLTLYQELGDVDGIARATSGLSRSATFRGELGVARALLDECLALYTSAGDEPGIRSSRFNLGVIFGRVGEYDRASAAIKAILASDREHPDGAGAENILQDLSNLVWIEMRRKDWAQVERYAFECLSWYDGSGHIQHALDALDGLAAAAAQGRPRRSARLQGAVSALREQTEYPLPWKDRQEYDDILASARGQIDEASFESAWAEGSRMSIEDAIEYALHPDSAEGDDSRERQRGPTTRLSKREVEVIRLVAVGNSNMEIALTLSISPNTVGNHLASIMNKLGVDSRTAAATWAVKNGLA